MWIDKLLEFSDSQALTATAVSTNVVNLSQDRDIGPGTPLWWVVGVEVALDGTTGDETYVATLQTDDNPSFTSPTTIATITLTRGDAVGTRYFQSLPSANEQYLRVNYTLGGTTPLGTVSSFITAEDPAKWVSQADGI
jgi:hypothetical protein